MTVDQIITLIIDELVHTTGTDLLAWISETYDRPLTIFRGFPKGEPPGEEDAPFLCFFANTHAGGQAAEKEQRQIGLVIGILDGEDDVETTEEDGVRKLTDLGSGRIAEFHRMVEDAIELGLVSNDFEIGSTEFDFSDGETWPLIVALGDINISWDRTIGTIGA